MKAWTWFGIARASAMKILGAMYQPVRVRVLTAIGLAQFMMLPSGATTVNGR